MIRPLVALLLCLAPFATAATAASPAPTPDDLNRRVAAIAPDLVEATVAIFIKAGQPGGGSGSGVIVRPDGLIMTAAHVTRNPGESFSVLLSDGRRVAATSLGVDHETDGALLKISTPGTYPFRPFLEEKNYEVGDWVIAAGHPGGPAIGRPAPLRLGRITKDGTRSGYTDPVTTTAAVISGDSGGPLFNLAGEVIGINSNIQGNWSVNNHVPVPCILDRWDALMAGETFGKAPDNQLESIIDDPFAPLRDDFLDLLQQHPDDPAATELLARPRLLDPHHMQEHIDRLQPDPEAAQRPFFGLRFDLASTEALVRDVLPRSPADRAGLRPGDVMTNFNDSPVSDASSFARLLSDLDANSATANEHALTINRSGDTLDLQVTPELRPARRHFPQPLASFISSMLREGNAPEVSGEFETMHAEFQAAVDAHASPQSIVELQRDGKTIALATVLPEKGHVVTKASSLGKPDDISSLMARHGGVDHAVRLVGIDNKRDLALLQTDTMGLTPVQWTVNGLPTGSLLLSPRPGSVVHGVITQPVRPAPRPGYDHPVTAAGAPPWLGLALDSKSKDKGAIVSRVDPDSPADRAGIFEGDTITAIDGTPIDRFPDDGPSVNGLNFAIDGSGADPGEIEYLDPPAALVQELGKRQPGDKFRLSLDRNGSAIDVAPVLDLPGTRANRSSLQAVRVDQALGSLSARGGELSGRRQGFPLALYHDTRLAPSDCGGPLVDLEGRAVGINIARSLRHRSLAIPASEVLEFVEATAEREPTR